MASNDNAKHISQGRQIKRSVYLQGTSGQVYSRGTGVCYNRDYGTAADSEGRRDTIVEIPSITNNRFFAGVLDHNVTMPSSGITRVTINEPGSVCLCSVAYNTVVASTDLTCLAGGGVDTGRFAKPGFLGRGAMRALETDAGVVLESNYAGSGALATDGITLTVADSSDYVAGTDKVLILGGEIEAGGGTVTPGIYDIASITDGTTIVLSTDAISGTALAGVTCSYVVINEGNSLVLGYLYDGDESGLVEWSSPPNAGSTGLTHMVGGWTYIEGGKTLAADCDYDLADGTIYGMRKMFLLMGDMTTSDVTIDLDTTGYKKAGTLDLTEILTIDDVTDGVLLEWSGYWNTVALFTGATEG